ncbi:MBL fold metallo-hydrolase [Kordiimonas aquimaris]|uniref:MBL fold metallo-hydrolase n=1 Tax=Kordiimonas aquimaris TaxID=707591 RepID=UPI0021CDF7DC|nr:MBL fold metallo-hydrolase [Kordiimonas aquimaris]
MSSKTIPIISSCALLFAVSAPGQTTEICHVANAGFLVKGEKTSVLIDGLMIEDQYEGRFALPSQETQEQMMKRTNLYDNLSVVVATHLHGDHFDPKATVAHLRTNPTVNYVLPADTLSSLEANGLTQEEQSRITFAPDNTQSSYNFDGVTVEVYDIDHGPNMPQNNGYRISVDGKSVFHTGDINTTRDQLSGSGVNALAVDALLIPFWFGMNDNEQRATIDESWSYTRIVPTHFSAKPAAWMEQFGGFGKLKQAAAAAFDNAVIVANEGECTKL